MDRQTNMSSDICEYRKVSTLFALKFGIFKSNPYHIIHNKYHSFKFVAFSYLLIDRKSSFDFHRSY